MLEGHEQRQAEQDERRAENQSNLATKGIHKRAVKALGENALKPTEFDTIMAADEKARDARKHGSAEIQRILNHKGYTAEHKQNQIKRYEAQQAEIFAEARQVTEETINEVMARETNFTLPPPTEDPVVLEAQLANARQDAIFELSAEENATGVYETLQDMATRNDPVMRHLLLETRFVDSYLRGTKQKVLLTGWASKKTDLKAKALGRSPEQIETVRELKQLPLMLDLHFKQGD